MDATTTQVLGTLVSLGIGWLGKQAGNSPVTGPKPWGKILAPLAAVGAGIGFEKLTGTAMPLDQLIDVGSRFGVQAIALHTTYRSVSELIKVLAQKRGKLPG
jgi:hypothetical protein